MVVLVSMTIVNLMVLLYIVIIIYKNQILNKYIILLIDNENMVLLEESINNMKILVMVFGMDYHC